jgi:exonuclease III
VLTPEASLDTHPRFPNITFASQNCNSLNISTNCPTQVSKVAAILSLQASIIFLSDVRLNSDVLPPENLFAPTYDMYYNSTKNKRGVCILIKSNLNYSIAGQFRDINNNILALTISIDNVTFVVVSVYGPNTNDNTFFRDLKLVLDDNKSIPCIIGGDWNLTVCTDETEYNIDTLNMVSPPSLSRSRSLAEICETYSLSDPYRCLHPYMRDYTYIPRTGKKNRSRIDFFIISDSILHSVQKCNISMSLDCTLFDHKSIDLSLAKPQKSLTLFCMAGG